MKRSLIIIAATAVGLALVVSYKPRPLDTPQAAALTTGDANVAGAQTVVGTDETLAGGLGDIQVKVTAANGKIVSVGMAQMNLHGPQSQQIANSIIPQLLKETQATNGGPVHAISGATYTMEAYQRSLQAALDKLKGGPNAGLSTGNGNGGVIPAPRQHEKEEEDNDD
ncbi:MAG TPA: FMN-binding protein [Thermoleophilia bacterium]|nr:FMN-binding protein [Thermoleophilia bacterium]